jgi:hypothetical protein
MKPAKLVAAWAVLALCVFGVAAARAQLVTNSVTLNILFIPQGPTNIVDGTNSFFVPEKSTSHNAAWFLEEIGTALHASQGATLSSAAKLVLLTGGNKGPLFAVIDGTNFYGLTNLMGLILPLPTTVVSGMQNGDTGLAFPRLKNVKMAQIGFNDVSILGGNGLQFILQGLLTSTVTDTAPAAGTGIYTESVSGNIIDLVGNVTQSNNLFYATGTVSYSGKGTLVWLPK